MKAHWDLLYFGGDFTSVDGVAAEGVIAWDGEEWITYPGLEGEVVDISPGFPLYTRFYVIGSFSLDGVDGTVNIAEWNETDGWIPLQTGDIQGDFYKMHRNGASLMVTGDFQQINGQPMANVAIYGLNDESWNNQGGELVTNGPVYDATWVNGRFLLAGDFTSVGTSDKAVTNLAYYDFYEGEWLAPPSSEQGPIYHVAFHEGVIYAASDFEDPNTFATLSGGLWYYLDYFQPLGQEPGQFHGILTAENQAPMLYGNYLSGGIGTTVYGIGELQDLGYLGGIIVTDTGFRAAAYYKDQLVVAGDFEILGGNPIKQIAFIELITRVIDPNSDERLAKVYAHADQIYVAELVNHQKAEIDIFDMNGRLLQSTPLAPIADTQTISLAQLPTGTYVYRLRTDEGLQAGQFVFFR